MKMLISSPQRRTHLKANKQLDSTGKQVLLTKDGWTGKCSKKDQKKKRRKDGDTPKKISFLQLWRFASGGDRLLVALGTIVALITGCGLPLIATVQGDVAQAFSRITRVWNQEQTDILTNTANHTDDVQHMDYSWDQFHAEIVRCCCFYFAFGCIICLSSTTQILCFLKSGENVVRRVRMALFSSILRQEIAWFDENSSGMMTSKMFDDLERMREGTGDKVAMLLQSIVQFVSGYSIAFYYDWRMTVIMACLAPLMILTGAFMARLLATSAALESRNYAAAGAVAEQALSSIRTVNAFNGQEEECRRYEKALREGMKNGIRRAYYTGTGLGISFIVLYSSYTLAFWIGTSFIADGQVSVQTVITVFFGVLLGSTALGSAGQHMAVIGVAQGAAAAVYAIIDRTPLQKKTSFAKGICPKVIKGHIRFNKVNFCYPTRPDVKVLEDFSLEIKPGETVALVGYSGSGKSTLVQLLLRYYTPKDGQILIDGYDIASFNLQHLRQLFGFVSQDPVLFNCSIEDNIRIGNSDVSIDQLHEALRMANAEKFVMKLPNGLNTLVGERGIQLSGGQKQRIAIARALVGDPKILLLDEATSALDSHSEAKVQLALEKARQGRTTCIIAHRLSTIRHVDKIFVIGGKGQVVEQGTHHELLQRGGVYSQLIDAQQLMQAADIREEEMGLHKSDLVEGQKMPICEEPFNLPEDEHNLTSFSYIDPAEPLIAPEDTSEEGSLKVAEDQEQELEEDRQGTRQTQKMRLKRDLAREGAKEQSLWQILKFARPEWPYYSVCVMLTVVRGCIYPFFSILFTRMLRIFSLTDMEEMRQQGHMWCLFFTFLGIAQAGILFTEVSLFGRCAETMTMRLRAQLFRNIMRMHIAYFDSPIHTTGNLATRLATDTPNVRAALDFRLGAVFSAGVAFLGGICLALYYNWQLAVLVLCALPIAGLGQLFHVRHLKGRADKDKRAYEQAGKVVLEAMENIRTVYALSAENVFLEKFSRSLDEAHKRSTKSSLSQALSFGFSSSIPHFIHALVFRFGLSLLFAEYVEPMGLFNVMFAISFSSTTLGFASSYFPEYAKARVAAGIIFKMLAEKPQIDSASSGGVVKAISGAIQLDSIHFSYPQRSKAKVLKGLDFSVQPGQRLALVGESGSGKSTICSLIERFYDPLAGRVLIDGEDIRQHNIKDLRSQIALVSQDPIMFDCSIRDNLLYGLDCNLISDQQLEETLAMANLATFVHQQLPQGWHTRVGEKGIQLSGGQKQRLAIARALLRSPKILLLDEATSALDSESEKMVQEALERVSEGRTCIVIAHRLSTITNAHQIVVLNEGEVVEKGTHQELLSLRGPYYELIKKAQPSTTTTIKDS